MGQYSTYSQMPQGDRHKGRAWRIIRSILQMRWIKLLLTVGIIVLLFVIKPPGHEVPVLGLVAVNVKNLLTLFKVLAFAYLVYCIFKLIWGYEREFKNSRRLIFCTHCKKDAKVYVDTEIESGDGMNFSVSGSFGSGSISTGLAGAQIDHIFECPRCGDTTRINQHVDVNFKKYEVKIKRDKAEIKSDKQEEKERKNYKRNLHKEEMEALKQKDREYKANKKLPKQTKTQTVEEMSEQASEKTAAKEKIKKQPKE